MVERHIDIVKAQGSIPCARTDLSWAYSKMVLHLHGMEEVGVRFPVGPHGEANAKEGRGKVRFSRVGKY